MFCGGRVFLGGPLARGKPLLCSGGVSVVQWDDPYRVHVIPPYCGSILRRRVYVMQLEDPSHARSLSHNKQFL